MHERYIEQVRLLMRALPSIAKEKVFALKGGSAIVLVREGSGMGKCALVAPGQRFSLGQRVMMLRPDKSRVLPQFFLHQLLSPVIQEDHILPLSKGSASPHLNIGALRRFPFILPSLSEQEELRSEEHTSELKSLMRNS